jgi:hypothetical protein
MSDATENDPDLHRCLRPGCGRKLTSPGSIARGFGPTCAQKVRQAEEAADLSRWNPRHVEQARELIGDAAIVPSTRPGVFHAISTDGGEIYRCAAEFCDCAAGQQDKPCYHRAAAIIVLASLTPAAQPFALAA